MLSTCKRLLYAAMLGLLLVGPASAVDVEGLYEARVPVESQGAKERSEAVSEALVQVLVKLTGRQDISAHEGLQEALQGATSYIQQYRYVAATPPATGQELLVYFDPAALSDLLSKQKLPLWSRSRPATLLWLAVEQNGRRALVGANSDNQTREVVSRQARRRGLPLRLPLLDLTDRGSISAGDVWGGFDDRIEQASERYETEAILVGRVHAGGGGSWQGRWTLLLGSQHEQWRTAGDSSQEAVEAGVDRATELLAQRFAQAFGEGTDETLLVEVQDVDDLGDYMRAVEHLASLSPVHSARPAAIEREAATFRLEISGGREAVLQAMRLGRRVVPLEQTSTAFPEVQDAEAHTEDTPQVALTPDLVVRLLP